MKYLKPVLLLIFVIPALFNISGQADSEFKPGGKPVFLLFSNVHSSYNKEGNSGAFEITRLYLGYEHFFSRSLSSRANIDIGDPGAGGLQMTAYVKNAFLQYKTKDFSGRVGMITTDQFNLIEKHWGYRYILKSFQDEYGLGPSADIGAAAEFLPAEFISFDASVLNGEGYKKLQSDSAFKYTLGITLKPFQTLQLRGYVDFMKKESAQKTVSFFAGYNYNDFRIGLEYSIQKNNRMIENHDFSGVSAFASLRFAKKLSVLARYDYLWSADNLTDGNPWNYNKDGQLFLAGLEWSPVQGVKITPVFMGWLPFDTTRSLTSTPGLYFEIRL